MQNCIHCQAQIADNAAFCPSCGKAQLAQCPNCKASASAGKPYCAECGTKLTVSAAAPAVRQSAFIRKPVVWISAVCTAVAIVLLIVSLALSDAIKPSSQNNTSETTVSQATPPAVESSLWDEIEHSETQRKGSASGTATNSAQNATVAAFDFYAQKDPDFGIEAYRVLAPKGWEVQGDVQWNYASSNAPAEYSMQATSADGSASVIIVSDKHYATLRYSGGAATEAAMYGCPFKAPIKTDALAKEVLGNLGFSSAKFSGSKNMDSDKALLNTYLLPEINKMETQLAGGAQSVQKPYLNLMLYTGTASFGGKSMDIKVVISSIGYQLVTSGYVTQIAEIWQMGGCHVMAAPKGKMAKYESDMAVIETNFIVNRNWLAGRKKMSEEIWAMLRNQQISDWRQANQMSAALSQRVDAILERSSNYSAAEGGSSLSMQDRYEEFIFNENSYDMGNGEQLRVDTKYDYVWRGQNGDIIASDSPGYNPNIGGSQSYEQLQMIR